LTAASVAAVATLLASAPAYGRARAGTSTVDYNHNPVVFVHGFDGSGAQFESQQLRLESNGYPSRYIAVLEYDSLLFAPALGNGAAVTAQEQSLFAQLDQLIAHIKAISHRPRVDLLAHSLGTALMQDYLNSSPQRAASVAHYVNIDGKTAGSPPGGVRTLALWGTEGPISQPPGRRIDGAENVDIPGSSHVQIATSPLSFAAFYKFFTGKAPRTTKIVAQTGPIEISGRALNFPFNSGLAGATVQVWPINQATGQRTSSRPLASQVVGSSGDWGPVTVQAGRRYELTLVRTDNPTAPMHHFYYEPFWRSDHLIRLLDSDVLRSAAGPPASGSVGMIIVRYKELWGDQGSQSDILTINGLSVCNATTCPLSKEVNGLFAADFDHDGQSNTSMTWPPYQSLGYFISSVDVFAPAQSPPTGKVTVRLKDRGTGPVQVITLPNFPNTTDDVTVQFNDFTPAQVTRAGPTSGRTTPHLRPRSKPRRTTPAFTG
jgi:hypothetical protein